MYRPTLTAALLALLCASPACVYDQGYAYTCQPGHEPVFPSTPHGKMARAHGVSRRFFELLSKSCTALAGKDLRADFSRRFGRLLPPGTPPEHEEEHEAKLLELAKTMKDTSDATDGELPAGFIFLGQFIDHDITLDAVSRLGETADPSTIENLRTPRLDLDSVYGSGPEGTPYFYAADGSLLTERMTDFRRVANGTSEVALIGDPRNDENGLVAQLHLLFIRFHNRVLQREGGDFHAAQQTVRWHYQWIVRHEFLPAIVEQEAIDWAMQYVDSYSHCGSGWFGWLNRYAIPDMPIEFAAAAYRFGHSQIRSKYDFGNGHIVDLFEPPLPPGSLGSFEKVKPENVVNDWGLFFDVDGRAVNRANPIDTRIAAEVFELPFGGTPEEKNLALRNLIRGDLTFMLPSGEQAAAYLGVPPLPESCPTIRTVREEAKLQQTPLWYYVLAEAEENGGRLGDVGGRIVALTLIRMLANDPTSFVNQPSPWTPHLGGGKTFTMGDLVRYTRSQ